MKRDYAEKTLERRIKITFLENHGWSIYDSDVEDYIEECMEDYEEYREWFLACCA